VWVADVARAVMTIAEEDPLEEESKVSTPSQTQGIEKENKNRPWER